ncbi:hypothetical protein WCQ02_39430 [Paraburkholderia tropica]|uniref:HNH endonuclease n=1 Tax=Paraburkholderia tropica TaxID=92647 RepID=A0ABX5MC85_9BURK|nr:hypothetical protein [Paraburkholderia tropica]PXX04216.1 hypothetical protein C7400_14710 [Paraburkholderia tropica]PZW69502.1 hypothetical protein C7399_14710 [Paraburkholderia tropica]
MSAIDDREPMLERLKHRAEAFGCYRGHVWQAPAASIKHGGHWCGACAILDRIHAKNGWKRRRYEATGKLPV